MTQLDLPPISFARYVDLLKRRRWQVIPVSLLGLAIGAAVALTVPRYYVTSAELRYDASQLLSPQSRLIDDPLSEKLVSARLTIPALAPAVMKELGWEEAADPDLDRRAAFEADVRNRIVVTDLGPAHKGRVLTNIRITFRDVDGERAATFLNRLSRRWMDLQLQEVEQASTVELEQLRRASVTLLEERDGIAREIESFERHHAIDPSLGGRLEAVSTVIQIELKHLEGEAAGYERELARLRAQLDGLDQRLAEGMPKQIKERVPPPSDPSILDKLKILSAQIFKYEVLLEVLSENNERYEAFKRHLDVYKAERAKLMPTEEYRLVPNPEYLELQRKKVEVEQQIREVLTVQQPLQARIEKLRKRLHELPALATEYKELLDRDAAARARLAENDADLRRAETRRRQVIESKPFDIVTEARAPLRPTEPNPTVLALLGSIIGLGVAIGLILALDAMRFTFKTMQDLEHGLPVPVLGGVSHLETYEERTESRRTRVAASVIASVVLILLVVVVTFYYVAPARLPAVVHDVLDLLLKPGD